VACLSVGGEQAVPGDDRHRQRLVADVLEEHDDPVPLVAHHHASAPFPVAYRAAHGEWPVRVTRRRRERGGPAGCPDHPPALGFVGRADVTVVAVSTSATHLLAEVRQQGPAPAGSPLRVLEHHVDPRAAQDLVPLDLAHCQAGRLGRRRGVAGHTQPAALAGAHRTDLLEQRDQVGEPAYR